jgi:hypothetical protein
MASFRIFGPYVLDLGTPGLAPGRHQDTFWMGWVPPPQFGKFTVTVTGHPGSAVPGSEDQLAHSLYTSTVVEWVPTVSPVVVKLDLVVHARLLNTGTIPIRIVNLCITFIEL